MVRESDIEKLFVWAVEMAGGHAWKFTSPSNRGVCDRIVALPDGTVWFVELKAPRGRLSELQKRFADECRRLNLNYAVLWTKEQVNEWAKISIGM